MASLGSARELTQGRMNAPPTGGINVGGALMRPGLRGIERASSRSARESTQGRINGVIRFRTRINPGAHECAPYGGG